MSPPRRFRSTGMTRRPERAILAIIVALALAAIHQCHPQRFRPTLERPVGHTAGRASAPGMYRVARVVDGDTILLVKGRERVRLIGADAPETVKPNWPVEPWGPEASQFTKKFLAGGEVRLEFDKELRDKYGRILAYVWVGPRMLNEELLRAGLARYEPQYHYSAVMKARFRRAEAEARAAHRGLWSGRQ